MIWHLMLPSLSCKEVIKMKEANNIWEFFFLNYKDKV